MIDFNEKEALLEIYQLLVKNFECWPMGLLTHWMMPSLAAARLSASSPSGCASLAMAAGEIKNGALLSKPRILVL